MTVRELIEQWDGYIFGIEKVNDYSSNTGEVIIVDGLKKK